MLFPRRLRLELFVVAMAAGELVAVLTADNVPSKPVAAVLTAVSALVLLGRRWQPLVVSVAAFAVMPLGVSAMPETTGAQFLALLATFAIVGAINTDRDAVIAWAAGAGALAYVAWVDPNAAGWEDFLLSLAFCSAMWAAGRLVSRRTLQAVALADLARRAELEQQDRTRLALAEERARIARELHDVVSHGLSVVVVQTLAARSTLADLDTADGLDTAVVDRHLDAVESTARDSLAEMRRMLGLLHLDDSAGDEPVDAAAPAPGLRHLHQLVERARSAGLDVDDSQIDVGIALPAGLELAVFRVIQEALTNAVKHAPGSHVDVALCSAAGAASIEIVDDGGRHASARPAGAGHGLVGMRERVALYGGTLTAGPLPAGGFRVRAEFPVGATSDPAPSPGPRRRRALKDPA